MKNKYIENALRTPLPLGDRPNYANHGALIIWRALVVLSDSDTETALLFIQHACELPKANRHLNAERLQQRLETLLNSTSVWVSRNQHDIGPAPYPSMNCLPSLGAIRSLCRPYMTELWDANYPDPDRPKLQMYASVLLAAARVWDKDRARRNSADVNTSWQLERANGIHNHILKGAQSGQIDSSSRGKEARGGLRERALAHYTKLQSQGRFTPGEPTEDDLSFCMDAVVFADECARKRRAQERVIKALRQEAGEPPAGISELDHLREHAQSRIMAPRDSPEQRAPKLTLATLRQEAGPPPPGRSEYGWLQEHLSARGDDPPIHLEWKSCASQEDWNRQYGLDHTAQDMPPNDRSSITAREKAEKHRAYDMLLLNAGTPPPGISEIDWFQEYLNARKNDAPNGPVVERFKAAFNDMTVLQALRFLHAPAGEERLPTQYSKRLLRPEYYSTIPVLRSNEDITVPTPLDDRDTHQRPKAVPSLGWGVAVRPSWLTGEEHTPFDRIHAWQDAVNPRLKSGLLPHQLPFTVLQNPARPYEPAFIIAKASLYQDIHGRRQPGVQVQPPEDHSWEDAVRLGLDFLRVRSEDEPRWHLTSAVPRTYAFDDPNASPTCRSENPRFKMEAPQVDWAPLPARPSTIDADLMKEGFRNPYKLKKGEALY